VAGSERQVSLDGRWALVTGAAKRIGAVIARTLHAAGANVAIHYNRSATDAEQLAAELNRRRAKSAFTVGADMRDIAAVERMAAHVLERTGGRLDVLVNNASNFYPTPIGTITLEQWDDLVRAFLRARSNGGVNAAWKTQTRNAFDKKNQGWFNSHIEAFEKYAPFLERQSFLFLPLSSAKGAKYESQGQALSRAKRVAPG